MGLAGIMSPQSRTIGVNLAAAGRETVAVTQNQGGKT